MPCVNGGVAVGIGLDYLFARWQKALRSGDMVYLPMEEAQYVRAHATTEVGPDAAIMLRHDWRTLASLPTARWIAALFSFDLRAALMSPIETALLTRAFPRSACRSDRRDQRMGRSRRSHRRTRCRQPRNVGGCVAIPCVGRTDPHRLRQRTDRRLHALGHRAWHARHRRPADRIRRCTDAGYNAGSDPIRLCGQRRRLPRRCRTSAAIRVRHSSIPPST